MSSVRGSSFGSNGFAGLASGMDTESMVEKLLSSTQAKIDREQAQNQQLLWKQEIYRSVISTLKTFQSSYFSFTSDTALISSSFFNSVSSSIIGNSNAIKVNASVGTQPGNITIDKITSLASGSKTTSGGEISGTVGGKIDASQLENLEQKITINGKEIDLKGATNAQAVADKINGETFDAGKNVKATVKDGKLTLTAVKDGAGLESDGTILEANKMPENVITVDGTKMGLEMIGVSDAYSKKGSTAFGFDANKGKPSLTLNVDGVERTITLDPEDYLNGAGTTNPGEVNIGNLTAALDKGLKSSFGAGVTATITGGKLSIVGEAGRHVTVKGGTAMEALGTYKDQSNKININSTLGSINLGEDIQGKEFEFEINGVRIKASASDRISDVINRVNSSDAGVTMSYSSVTDKFTMESKSMGAGVTIEVKDIKGNLTSSIFGGTSGSSVTGGSLDRIDKDGSVTGTNDPAADIKSGSFTMEVNGQRTTLTLPAKSDDSVYTTDEIIAEFNEQLESNHGLDKNGKAVVQLSKDATGKISIDTKAGYIATIPDDLDADNLATKLGFTADQTTAPPADKVLVKDLGLDGKTITIGTGTGANTITLGGNDSVENMIKAVNDALGGTGKLSFDAESNSFTLESTGGASAEISGSAVDTMFGAQTVATNTASSNPASVQTEGKSAVITVNGVEMEKNTNNFEIDGIQIELVQTSDEAITISTVANTDKIVEGVESFVNDYNKMIEDLHKLLGEKTEYKDYPPLTAEEKKEMSESEIKLWEEKAKMGLVRSDNEIEGILSDLRSSLYEKSDGGKYALYDIGIETGSYKENGKLHFDKEKFTEMLKSDPKEVEKVFTNAKDGISQKFDKILDDAVSATEGSLTQIAGTSSLDVKSSMYKRIKDSDDRIVDLKRKYEIEKNRYWREFNAMEQAISSMNQQSSWLSQQMM